MFDDDDDDDDVPKAKLLAKLGESRYRSFLNSSQQWQSTEGNVKPRPVLYGVFFVSLGIQRVK